MVSGFTGATTDLFVPPISAGFGAVWAAAATAVSTITAAIRANVGRSIITVTLSLASYKRQNIGSYQKVKIKGAHGGRNRRYSPVECRHGDPLGAWFFHVPGVYDRALGRLNSRESGYSGSNDEEKQFTEVRVELRYSLEEGRELN